MQCLEFDFECEAADGIKGAELACTWASLRVRVNKSVLPRVVDPSDHRIRDRTHAPLYPLAEWLATNWWSLLHEPEDRGDLPAAPFWNDTHLAQRGRATKFRTCKWCLSIPRLV